jgi:hypothetical protein
MVVFKSVGALRYYQQYLIRALHKDWFTLKTWLGFGLRLHNARLRWFL